MFDLTFTKATPKFDGSNFSFKQTIAGTPVFALKIHSKERRIAVPIKEDGAWQRFNSFREDGWTFKSIMFKDFKFQVILQKEFPNPKQSNTIVGVDVGSVTLASCTVLRNGKVKRQLYFGRDLWDKQRRFIERRATLQSKRTHRAEQSIERLKRSETNFIKTRCYQVAWQVVKLAKEFGASVSIEKLHNLRSMRGQKRKEANKRINRIPYFKFFEALKSICVREGIAVIEVPPRNTSRTCYKCGTVDKRSRVGVLFRCKNCGHTVNADRNASVNIASRAVETTIGTMASSNQISTGRVVVNRPLRSDDVGLNDVVHLNQPMECHRF